MTIEKISTFILVSAIAFLALIFFDQQYDGQLFDWVRSLI